MKEINHHDCGRIRQLTQEGNTVVEIAREVGVSVRSVRRHATGDCKHHDSVVKQTLTPDRDCPFCGETIKRYPAHLPDCPDAPAEVDVA